MLPLELIDIVCGFDGCLHGKLTFDMLVMPDLLANPHPIVADWILSGQVQFDWNCKTMYQICQNTNPDVVNEAIKHDPPPHLFYNNPTDAALDYMENREHFAFLSSSAYDNPRVITHLLKNPNMIFWPQFAQHNDARIPSYILSHWKDVPMEAKLKCPNNDVVKRVLEEVSLLPDAQRNNLFLIYNVFSNGADCMVRYLLENEPQTCQLASYAQHSPDDRIAKYAIEHFGDQPYDMTSLSKNQMIISWLCEHPEHAVLSWLSSNPLIFDDSASERLQQLL
jgi:hypothetical protein